MKVLHYKDDNGEFLMAVSSSVPGLTIVPLGKTRADAIELDDAESEKAIKAHKAKLPKQEPAMTNEDLTKLVLKLQADIEKLTKKTG